MFTLKTFNSIKYRDFNMKKMIPFIIIIVFIQACSKSPEELGFESQEDLDSAISMGFETFSSYSAQGKFSSPERALKALRTGFVDSDQLDKYYYEQATKKGITNSDLLSIVANIENYYGPMAISEHLQSMSQTIQKNTKKELGDKNLAVFNQEYLGFDYEICLKFNSFLDEMNDDDEMNHESLLNAYKPLTQSLCNEKRISEYLVLKEKAEQAKIEAENKAHNDKIMAKILESRLEQAEKDADQYNEFSKCGIAAGYANFRAYSSFFNYNKVVIMNAYQKKEPEVYNHFVGYIGHSVDKNDPWVLYGLTQNYLKESCVPIAAGICNAAELGASMLGLSKISETQQQNLLYCPKFR